MKLEEEKTKHKVISILYILFRLYLDIKKIIKDSKAEYDEREVCGLVRIVASDLVCPIE